MRLVLALSTALILSAPALAQQTPRAPASSTRAGQGITIPRAAAPLVLTDAQRAEINTVLERGRQLALIDQAARISTQDMLARIADPAAAGVIGWVAEPEGNGMTATYYARVAGAAAEAPTPPPAPTPAETPTEPQADATELAGEAAPSASEITSSLGSGQRAAPAAAETPPAEAAAEAPAPDANYVAVYRTQVLGGRVSSPSVFTGDARPQLTGTALRMARAREAVVALAHPPCSRTDSNVLLLPPAGTDDAILVYEIPPRTTAAQVPVGGQYRTTVTANGRVGDSTQIGGECAMAAVAPVQEGQRPRPVIVNARAATLPNELHVFIALWTGRPVVVATGETRVRLWGVTGEGIAELRDQPAAAPASAPAPSPGR